MPRLAALLVALASCTQLDIFIDAATDEGTVYDCRRPNGTVLELCYLDDSEDELGAMVGATCETGERNWVAFTNALSLGCNYHCPHYGPGCNAHAGCWCPEAP